MISENGAKSSPHHESLEREDSQEILKEIIRKLGKDVGKELGKTVSLKDLVKALKPDIVNGIIKYYVEMLVRDAQSCRTSYCVAMKLSSIYSQLGDICEIIETQPNDLFEKILFDPDVINAARNWPIDSVLTELDLVQFANLRQVKGTISNWIQKVNKTEPRVEMKEIPVGIGPTTQRSSSAKITSQSKESTPSSAMVSPTSITSTSTTPTPPVSTSSTAKATNTSEVKREDSASLHLKQPISSRDYIIVLIGILIGLTLILMSQLIP